MSPIVAFLTALVVLAPLTAGLLSSAHEDVASAAKPQPFTSASPGQRTPALLSANSPTPVFPLTYLTAYNNTGTAASGLRVFVTNAATLSSVVENAPGCPAPRYEYSPPPSPLYSQISVLWDTACVDPGEAVLLEFGSDCPGCVATVNSYGWLFGTPTPTPSPTPTSLPTPTPSPTPTSPPTPTSSPTPTAVPGGLPKTGGAPGAGGAPFALLAALAGFGALFVAATCISARRRQRRRFPSQ